MKQTLDTMLAGLEKQYPSHSHEYRLVNVAGMRKIEIQTKGVSPAVPECLGQFYGYTWQDALDNAVSNDERAKFKPLQALLVEIDERLKALWEDSENAVLTTELGAIGDKLQDARKALEEAIG